MAKHGRGRTPLWLVVLRWFYPKAGYYLHYYYISTDEETIEGPYRSELPILQLFPVTGGFGYARTTRFHLVPPEGAKEPDPEDDWVGSPFEG